MTMFYIPAAKRGIIFPPLRLQALVHHRHILVHRSTFDSEQLVMVETYFATILFSLLLSLCSPSHPGRQEEEHLSAAAPAALHPDALPPGHAQPPPPQPSPAQLSSAQLPRPAALYPGRHK